MRIELSKKQPKTLRFVVLADGRSHCAEAAHAAEHATIGFVGPPYVARAAPPVCAQCVESAVIANAIGGVTLDRVGGDIAERTPRNQRTRILRDHRGSERPLLGYCCLSHALHGVSNCGWLGGQHSARWTLREHLNRLLTHAATLRPLAVVRVSDMTALSLESAKTIAIVIAIAFLAFAVISAWVIKNITMKIISIVLMLGLGLGVWTQRTNLQDCADRAKTKVEAGIDKGSITCEFFGSEVSVF